MLGCFPEVDPEEDTCIFCGQSNPPAWHKPRSEPNHPVDCADTENELGHKLRARWNLGFTEEIKPESKPVMVPNPFLMWNWEKSDGKGKPGGPVCVEAVKCKKRGSSKAEYCKWLEINNKKTLKTALQPMMLKNEYKDKPFAFRFHYNEYLLKKDESYDPKQKDECVCTEGTTCKMDECVGINESGVCTSVRTLNLSKIERKRPVPMTKFMEKYSKKTKMAREENQEVDRC